MKASEIRELSVDERLQKVNDLKEELFNLRFQLETDQLDNSRKISQTKRDIARIKTIINEELIKQKSANQPKGE
jgi:large subunit ribosomal protein L29